jgi:hypothetical protein
MNSEKLARRKRMGDDPTAGTKSNSTMPGAPPAFNPEQPNPGMPQGKGNMMGNPMNGRSMGGGMPGQTRLDPNNPQSMYGDPVFGADVFAKLGGGGYAPRSDRPQGMVCGTKWNTEAYGTVAQPMGETQVMMEGMYQAQQAGAVSKATYGEMEAPPFQVSPMGLYGVDMDKSQGQSITPGQIPSQMSGQMADSMPLQGMPDAQQAVRMGMDLAPDNGSKVPGSAKTTIPRKQRKKA